MLFQKHNCCLAAIMLLTFPVFAGPQEDFIAAARRSNLKLAQKVYAAGGVEVNVIDDKGAARQLRAHGGAGRGARQPGQHPDLCRVCRQT